MVALAPVPAPKALAALHPILVSDRSVDHITVPAPMVVAGPRECLNSSVQDASTAAITTGRFRGTPFFFLTPATCHTH